MSQSRIPPETRPQDESQSPLPKNGFHRHTYRGSARSSSENRHSEASGKDSKNSDPHGRAGAGNKREPISLEDSVSSNVPTQKGKEAASPRRTRKHWDDDDEKISYISEIGHLGSEFDGFEFSAEANKGVEGGDTNRSKEPSNEGDRSDGDESEQKYPREQMQQYHAGLSPSTFIISQTIFKFDLFLTPTEVEWAIGMMRGNPSLWEGRPLSWHLDRAQERMVMQISCSAKNKIGDQYAEEDLNAFIRDISSLAQIEEFGKNFNLTQILGWNMDIQGHEPLTPGGALILLFARNCPSCGLTLQIMCGLNILVSAIVFENIPPRFVSPSVVQTALCKARYEAPRGRSDSSARSIGFGDFGLNNGNDESFVDSAIALAANGEGFRDEVTQRRRIDRSPWSDFNIEPAVLLTTTITRRRPVVVTVMADDDEIMSSPLSSPPLSLHAPSPLSSPLSSPRSDFDFDL
ncbi:hypothetical protein TWF730_007096 [Orbilia blumenaviensis]|uniref:Uncharacterized protein n=1 Tax=Orbilia blumenaviensis TaxID=1796055 RepID=A0AAV9VJ51_9PEZI